MIGATEGNGALLGDRHTLDPIAGLLDGFSAEVGARRWVLTSKRDSVWRISASARTSSHRDDLYPQLADSLGDPPSISFVPTIELGSPGLRLDAAGVHELAIVVFVGGPEPVTAFFEEADRGRTARLSEALSSDALARIGSVVPAMLDASRKALETEALSRWLPVLRRVTRDEEDETGALVSLAELLDAASIICVRHRGQATHVWAVWRGADEWQRHDGPVTGELEDGRVEPESVPALAASLGVPGRHDWKLGTSNEARPMALAVAGGGVSTEGTSVAASLLSSASKRGRDLSAARTNALLQERARIASMIHEGITQVLTNVVLQMEILERLMDEPQAAREMLKRLRTAVLEALDSLRGAILELTPAAPEWSDLAGGLKRFAEDFAAQWGLEVGYGIEGKPREVDPEILALVFGFVQEGLSNVRKHAEVSEADLQLRFTSDTVRVSIVDHGKGFDPHVAEEEGFRQHQGLSIMRSRARLAGGSFDVGPTEGAGTTVTLELHA